MSKIGCDIPDSHLQSPIRDLFRRFLVNYDQNQANTTNIPNYIKILSKNTPILLNNIHIDSEKLYGTILTDLFDHNKDYNDSISSSFLGVYNSVVDHVKVHTPFQDDLNIRCMSPSNQLIMSKLYSVKSFWENIRTSIQHEKNQRTYKWKYIPYDISDKIKGLYISQYFALIQIEDLSWYLMDYDQIMMIADTISSRVYSLWYCLEGIEKEYIPDYEKLSSIYRYGDIILKSFGNDAYKMIKSWEPIIQGIMLKKYDPLSKSSDFIRTIVQDLRDEGFDKMIDLYNYVEECDFSVEQLAELHGIYRHWGHPTINEEKGCEKIKKIAKTRPAPSLKIVKKMVSLFRRQFCISFIQNHNRWPCIDTSKMSKGKLRSMIESNSIHINLYSSQYPLHQWGEIKFGKEFEFDYHMDFTDLCDDKAIGLPISEIKSMYSSEVLGERSNFKIHSRRLLIEMLKRKDINIKEICETIMNRDIPDNWKIVYLHSKERELKMDPRMFAMLVLEMRVYFCVTESNLASSIFKYFPQQTMTLTESELSKRLYSLSKVEEDSIYCPVFANIDFKSWNIHWSYNSTSPFFKVIDELFGTPGLYTYTHQFFQESLICVASYFDPPSSLKNLRGKIRRDNTSILCDKIWEDHYGGFEGLRQKGWTLITICLLLMIEYTTGIKCYIIGQGDNQICKLMLPKQDIDKSNDLYLQGNQEYISSQIDDFFNYLTEYSHGIGLVVKVEESWVSYSVINYGKDILFNGAYLPQGLKRISRVLPDVNEVYPTLLSKISTLQTTGLSTSQKCYDIICPYIICQTETVLTILRDSYYSLVLGSNISKNHILWPKSPSGIKFILHGDSNLFNMPIMSLYNYLYRGHPDPLTLYLSFLNNNLDKCNTCKSIYTICSELKIPIGEGDPLLLISDPLSLNIMRPKQVSQIVRHHVNNSLIEITRNKHLKPLFTKKSEKEDDKLCKYLLNSRPCYPRVMHEIMRLTTTGTRLGIISKFSNTRTIFQITNVKKATSFIKQIFALEKETYFDWIMSSQQVDHFKNIRLSSPPCPTILANKMRNYTWNNVLNGKKIEGVTVPFPMHQFSIEQNITQNVRESVVDIPHTIFHIGSTFKGHELLNKRGPFIPYIGSTTREKTTGKIFQLPEISRPLSAAQRIVQITKWCISPYSRMYQYMEDLALSHTNVPLDLLELSSCDILSGSMVHRLNDHITKKRSLNNSRPNLASHIYISTDLMGKYSKGSENVNLHFQGVILTGLALLNLLTLRSGCIVSRTNYLKLVYNCQDCEEYLHDDKLVNEEDTPDVNKSTNNPLLYTKVEELPHGIGYDGAFIKLSRSIDSPSAAASLIFSKIIKGIGSSISGITEKSAIINSNLSIQDIINIGLKPIIHKLAMLMYLHFHDALSDLPFFLGLHGPVIWRELSTICLFPEILPDLFEMSGESQQASLFESVTGVSRLLNNCLMKEIEKISRTIRIQSHNFPDTNIEPILFYMVPGCGITRCILLWTRYIHLLSKGMIDIRDIFEIFKRDSIRGLNLPSLETVKLAYQQIRDKTDISSFQFVMLVCPLRLSILPPEASLGNMSQKIKRRLNNEEKKQLKISRKHQLTTLRCKEFSIRGLEYALEIPGSSRQSINLAKEYKKDVTVVDCPQTYRDHQFGLVGNLSCAFMKFLQIIHVFDIDTDGDCVCLADGEGSVSKLMYRLSGRPVLFNTLVNNTKLVPQRGVHYIPGEFIDDPEGIVGGQICAMLGGDLVEDYYLKELFKIIPASIKITTFDAESTTKFTPSHTLNLLTSVLKICFIGKSKSLIYKTYITNVKLLADMVSIINTIYKSIFIVVPIFSSNETNEVFIYATSFEPNISFDEIGNKGTTVGNVCLDKFRDLKLNRLKDRPLQYDRICWIDLTKEALVLGFPLNIHHYISKLTHYYFDIDLNKSLENQLNQIISSCKSFIRKQLDSYIKSNYGLKLTLPEMMAMCSTGVLHIPLDKLCEVIINMNILLLIYKERSEEKTDKIINELLSLGYEIRYGFNNIYKFDRNNFNNIRETLKSYWRVWGYFSYKSYID